MNVWKDTPRYQALLRRKDLSAIPLVRASEVAGKYPAAYILTGDKTPDFGGGPSPFGFVMVNENPVARASLDK